MREKKREAKINNKPIPGSQLDLNIPDLDTHPKEWFDLWDADGSGTLEPPELVRALIRTMCISPGGDPLLKRAHVVREMAFSLWMECGFHPWDSIDYTTFIQVGGLADTFLHNVVHGNEIKDESKAWA